MSKTITKTSLRGFTLIELLVVIAIIGLLSTAIMGPVQTGLKKGRDTRKISDLTQVQGALLQFAGDTKGTYPASLLALDPTYMKADAKMYGEASALAAGVKEPAARDKFMYVTYKDLTGNIVAYHLGVALENQNASLQGDTDCSDLSNNLGIIDETQILDPFSIVGAGVPATTASTTCTSGISGGLLDNSNINTSAPGAGNPGSQQTYLDFSGDGTAEALGGVCTADLTTCIFDIIPR